MMKCLPLFILSVTIPLSAWSFHVQIGFTGWSHRLARYIEQGVLVSPASAWISDVHEIGAAPELVGLDYYGGPSSTVSDFFFARYETTSSSGPVGARVSWNPHNPARLIVDSEGMDSTEVDIAGTVRLRTFGDEYLPYYDDRFSHGILTVRGDPNSIVMNDTSADRTVNGVDIPAGGTAALPFPVYLETAEIPNVKFYDLDSGAELAPYDYGGVIYFDGYYTLGWTGNIRISDGTRRSVTNDWTFGAAEPLVFGDIAPASSNRVLFAENNALIYANGTTVSTNIVLNTWWDFDHGDWGGSPVAYINDEEVCAGHSTSHIIDYTVSANGVKTYGGIGSFVFTMSQTPQSGYPGGNCTMRCWDASLGAGTSAYANAPADHKAEVSAGTGVARFRMTINKDTGAWKVVPL